MKVNFSSKINALHVASTNSWLFLCMNPIFATHINLMEVVSAADEITDEEMKTERLNAYIEAARLLDPVALKKHFEDFIDEYQKAMMNKNWEWFETEKISFSSDLAPFKCSSAEVLRCKNTLTSLFVPIYSMLNELDRSHKMIEAKLARLNDTTRSLTSGLVGGKLGAVVGSMILPGIGTVVGAAIGGYMTESSQQDSLYEGIYEDVNNCLGLADRMRDYLVKNVKLIYSCIHDLDKLEYDLDRKAFMAVKDKYPEAYEAFDRFYAHQLSELQKIMESKPEESELTFQQVMDQMFEYIKEGQEHLEAA